MTIAPEAPATTTAASKKTPAPKKTPALKFSATVDRDGLLDALKFTGQGMNTRPAMHVLTGVLLEASRQGVVVSRFDFEQANQEVLPGRGSGRVLVHASTLRDLVNALDKGEVTLSGAGARLAISQGDLTYTLPPMALEDYPALPEVTNHQIVTTYPEAAQFAADLQRVLSARGKSDTLPQLMAVCLDTTSGLEWACTDRYRLAVQNTDLLAARLPRLLIPGAAAEVAAKGLAKSTSPVEVRFTGEVVRKAGQESVIGGFVTFTDGRRSVTTRLVDGEYPKYKALLPTDVGGILTMEQPALLQALRQVGSVARVISRNSVVRFELASELLLCAGLRDGDDPHAQRKLTGTYEGIAMVVGCHPDYLQDGLTVIGKQTVRIGFVSSHRPLLISSDEVAGFRYLLMPIRLGS